ncbi:hypothetical protein HR45_04900 [Shewanella mangrovi]|uniref:DUF748 domain-containing protein n=1 Tax=Shewanella mangrovi TaxID=1515746 RepID=A0A094K253_9GAMM|nr:DUF748 domain-containing protein [Shewanella mangrovi]KFZ38756.1 hypothetical protein HR45_04900 [Shewanella mangrovi]
MFAAKLKGILTAYRNLPRLLKVSFWLLSSYLLYAVLLGLLAPAIVRSVAPEKLTNLLGRQVSLQQFSINPFLLRVRMNDVAVAGNKGEKPLLAFQHLETEFNLWQSLFNQAWCVDHLTLNGLQSQVTRLTDANGNVAFNFDDVITRLQTPTSGESNTAATDTQLADIRVGSVHINATEFAFNDDTANVQLAYHDINFALENFATRSVAVDAESTNNPPSADVTPNQYHLSLTGQDKGNLTAAGQVLLAPLDVSGSLQLNNITLLPFWGYVAPMLEAKLTDGALSLDTQYTMTQAPQQPLVYAIKDSDLTLNNVQFADEANPVVKLPKLSVSGVSLSSASQQVAIASVAVDDLWLSSQFDQQGLSLAALFTPKTAAATDAANATATDNATTAATNTATEPAQTAPQWQVKLSKFQLNKADINLREQQLTQGVDWRVYPLNIATGSIDSQLSAPLAYQVSLAVSQSGAQSGGTLSSDGSIDIAAKQASGSLQLSDLLLPQFQPYLSQYLNIELPKGLLSTGGKFSADANGHAIYQGDVALADLEIKDAKQHRPLLKWQQLAVDSVDFDLAKQQLLLGNVTLDKLFAKVTINQDRSTNIGELVVTKNSDNSADVAVSAAAKPEAQDEVTSASPFKVSVASITINDSSAFFADNSLTPNFATGIEELHGKISSLSSVPGTKATVDIAGKIDRYAPMSLKGEINPLLPQPYLDLDLLFKSVELTSVNPYSGTYAGYYIDKGQLTLALNYQLENNKLNGNNHVVIDQLKLGNATDSELATSLPVTLAIALLQDRHGVIDLGLPVSGDLDNPDFSIGGIIWTAFSNVITKAVTAPFSFLAGLISSDEELNLVAFDAGSAKLSSAEKEKLQTLAKALADRPKLTLSIEASVNAQQDSQALAERKLHGQLLQQSGLDGLPQDFSASQIPATGKLTDALLALYQQQFKVDPATQKVHSEKAATNDQGKLDEATLTTLWHIGLYNQLLNAESVTDNDLGSLAQERSQAVKAYLVDSAAVAPERVFLLDSKTQLNKAEAQAQLSLDAN